MRALDRFAYFLRVDVSVAALIKSVFLWAALILAVATEAWLIGMTLSIAQRSLRPWSPSFIVAGLVLPLVAAAAFFRLPMGRRRLPTHYAVKPVGSTNTSPAYDLQAITALLRRELALWPTKGSERAAYGSPGATLTVSQLTIPLEWLSNVVRRYITGTSEVIIETTLIETGDSTRLESWARNYGRTPSLICESLSSDASIAKAVQTLALGLIATIDPALGANIKWELEDFDGALQLFRNQPASIDRDMAIALILMQMGQDRSARQQFRFIEDRYVPFRRRRVERDFVTAQFHIAMGEYAKARTILRALKRPPAFGWSRKRSSEPRRVWKLLGDCDRDGERPDVALVAYDEVEHLLLAEIRRLVGLTERDDLEACLWRSAVCAHPMLETFLAELDELIAAKAVCHELQGTDPIPEYERLLAVLEARSGITSPESVLMRYAQVKKYLADAFRRAGDPDAAASHFRASCHCYENAITAFENHYLPLDVDLGAKTNLAWCECGMLQCQRALYALEGLSAVPADVTTSLLAVKHLVNFLDKEDGRSFDQRWRRISRHGGESGAAGDEAFWDAAIFLTDRVVRQEPGSVGDLIADLEQVGPVSTVGPVEEQLNRLLVTFGAADGPSGDEVHHLLLCIAGLLGVLRDVPEAELGRGDYEESLKQRCLEKFDALDGHHQAEGNYGCACFFAILCERNENTDEGYIGATLEYLEQAISHSRTFIGRARTDSDFFHLRQRPEFRKLLELSPEQGTDLHADHGGPLSVDMLRAEVTSPLVQ